MLEWVIIMGMAVAMYIILYKYERKMDKMQELIDKNRKHIDKNYSKLKNQHDKIDSNNERLDKHYNHFEKLWVAKPTHSHKNEEKSKKESEK